MKIQLIRHATIQLKIDDQTILVDPMFAKPRQFVSLTFGKSAGRNPVVPLSVDVDDIKSPTAILVTHAHFDHFDRSAILQVSKGIPVFCQPSDEKRITGLGFKHVFPVGRTFQRWENIELARTRGKHGRGIIGYLMGHSSGYIIKLDNGKKVYITGDTIWCDHVLQVIKDHAPDVIVVNTGEARFNWGDPITMDAEDVLAVCRNTSGSKVVAVHMDALNHCRLSRAQLVRFIENQGLTNDIYIPKDGEILDFD